MHANHYHYGASRCVFRLRGAIPTVIAFVGLCAAGAAAQTHVAASAPAADAQREARAHIPLSEIAGVKVAPAAAAPTEEPTREYRRLQIAFSDQIAAGRVIEAIAGLESALEKPENEHYELYYLLGLARARLGRDGEARMAAERAATMRPEAADVRYLLGELYNRQGQSARAIEQYRTATLAEDREPNNARVTAAWFFLGRALDAEGYLTAAQSAYSRFDELISDIAPEHRRDPDVAALLHDRPYGALEYRLTLLGKLGDKQEALRVARSAHEQKEDDPFLLRLHVRALLDAGQAKEALATIRGAAHGADGDLTGALLTLAVQAARDAGELDQWIAQIERDAAADTRVELATALAERLEALQRHADALRLWRAIAAGRPNDARSVWELAAALKRNGKLADALECLVRSLRDGSSASESQPAEGAASLPMDYLAAWMKSFEATDEFLKLVAAYGRGGAHDFATDFIYGITAAGAGQDELATQLLQSCLTTRPTFAQAHVAWGRLLASHYRWKEAREHANAAIRISDDVAGAHALLADVHSALDENSAAESEYRRAVALAPNDVGIRLAMARHYDRLGSETATAAQRRYGEVLTLDPRNAEAMESLIRSYVPQKLEIARDRLAAAEAGDFPEDALRRVRTIVRYGGDAQPEDHAAELRRQFTEHPDDLKTGLYLVEQLNGLERGDDLNEIAERLRTLAPQDDSVMRVVADAHVRRMEYEPAMALLGQLVERYPNRLSYLLSLTNAATFDFQTARARDLLRRLLTLDLEGPVHDEIELMLLGSYLRLDDPAAGLPYVDELIQKSPQDQQLQSIRIRLLSYAGRKDDAVKAATDWLADDPTDAARRATYVFVMKEVGEFRNAIEQVREWVGDPPDNDGATDWLLDLLLRDGRADEALELVRKLPQNTLDESFRRRLRIGDCQLLGDHADAALAEFEALLKDDQARQDYRIREYARAGCINALLVLGEYDKALAKLDEWSKERGQRDPTVDAILLLERRASILQEAGRTDEAIDLLRKLLALEPNTPARENNYGYYLVDQGRDLEGATEQIRRALAREPLNSSYLDSYGWAFYKAGDFAAARRYLTRAVRLREGMDSVTILDHLGDTEHRLGDDDGARARWDAAVKRTATKDALELLGDEGRAGRAARLKLDALAKGQTPPVAPVAAEQHGK